jgi:hypothetical protein
VLDQFRAAVLALPRPVRLAYVLQRVGDVPVSTIAELSGCTVRDVRRRISAADRRLRRQNLAVIGDRVRLDAEVPWHDIREMRVLREIRAVPVVRVGFAAIRDEASAPTVASQGHRALRYGALVACCAAVFGFGAWLGPLVRTVTG